VALIVGAFAERIKFSAVLLFSVLWFTFAYLPMAHMVWFWPVRMPSPMPLPLKGDRQPGWLFQKGALDFAGGTVVHINAAVAGLVGAYMIGKRIGFGKRSLASAQPDPDHGRRLAAVGGLVRLQRRLGLEANGTAALAFVNTILATAAAVCPGASANGSARASPPCWAPLPAPWPAWWPSPRPPASSASWAPWSWACSLVCCACGA
jgi:Amt family ammonium transporter